MAVTSLVPDPSRMASWKTGCSQGSPRKGTEPPLGSDSSRSVYGSRKGPGVKGLLCSRVSPESGHILHPQGDTSFGEHHFRAACLPLGDSTAPLGWSERFLSAPCVPAPGEPQMFAECCIRFQAPPHRALGSPPVSLGSAPSPEFTSTLAGGGQVVGAGEGTAVLTLMLSCQRWAFWKFSAASASL